MAGFVFSHFFTLGLMNSLETQDVNDLATSPVNPYIIASASDDTSVRIWSVEEKHRSQPCLCILAGEGHSWNLLSVVRCFTIALSQGFLETDTS